MKIVSFPHYTCGGLLCDILNGTWSEVQYGGIDNKLSNTGKLPDVDGMLFDFDHDVLMQNFIAKDRGSWLGTHCWVGNMDLEKFEKIIVVSTMTYKSKLYRWIRACHHWYQNSSPWQNLSGIDMIDKERETAKNYLKEFPMIHHPRAINIEFADVVELRASFIEVIGSGQDRYLQRWRDLNSFLFDPNLLTCDAANRFYEAEFEFRTGKHYVYQ